ncbi:hypothetical protein [Candidatus Odyssella thessalonicensis]|uniref:hypothetical protein n=1 Tax=Candidatus Odyssella thessalonicensis TaxID=84647 RepID=UPI000225BEB7|nr:hypothetical protein [Candidatus Odyssella thessalonicensis]
MVDLQDTFQKIKTRDPIDQIAFADFMAEFEPVHAIPVRWFFRFFNILLGRNNDNA